MRSWLLTSAFARVLRGSGGIVWKLFLFFLPFGVIGAIIGEEAMMAVFYVVLVGGFLIALHQALHGKKGK